MNNDHFSGIIRSRTLWACVIFLLFAAALNFVSSEAIQYFYPDRTPVIDTLFRLTPQVMWTQYLTDVAVLISPIVLLVIIIKKDAKHLPYYLCIFALGYLFRAFLIILNPMGGYFGNMSEYGLTSILQHGMFPSGHTLLVFLTYYLGQGFLNKKINSFFLIGCLVEVISLVLSRGHYGIDIVGGILLAYFAVFRFKGLKEKLIV
jgi:membrane-associated phospholipid phosphatase